MGRYQQSFHQFVKLCEPRSKLGKGYKLDNFLKEHPTEISRESIGKFFSLSFYLCIRQTE